MSTQQDTSRINMIVIHCSATPNGKIFTASDIDRWHKDRKFIRSDQFIDADHPLHHIGYHFVIRVDGIIENGRKIHEMGAHVKGHNGGSIGICMIGTDKFSEKQWSELADLVQALKRLYPSINSIVGHRDLSPDTNGNGVIEPTEWTKTCPGFDVDSWLRNDMKPAYVVLYQDVTEQTVVISAETKQQLDQALIDARGSLDNLKRLISGIF